MHAKRHGFRPPAPVRDTGAFGPEELRELAVAFENCCAAIPQTAGREFREMLAARLISWARFGAVNGTQLYLRALRQYRALYALPAQL
jgi:hypothetical protein